MVSGTDLRYAPTALSLDIPLCLQANQGMVLRPCYAMSGTDLAYSASCLRACYATSGTALAYAATVCCAMSGTELAYAATSEVGLAERGWQFGTLSAYARATRCPVLFLPCEVPRGTAVSITFTLRFETLTAKSNANQTPLPYKWYGAFAALPLI
eukprot:2315017-Rhodomonas_salina.3